MIKESNSLLITALDFAIENHKNQFRQSGEPYVEHPKRVRGLLAEAGFGEAVQIAGLLHGPPIANLLHKFQWEPVRCD